MSYQLVSTSETAFWAGQCLKFSQNLENIPVLVDEIWMAYGMGKPHEYYSYKML
jgi:hypothetical protein